MPRLKANDDAETQLRNERKKRKLSAKKTQLLLKQIATFADQQETFPKKPTEIRKFVGEVADYIDGLKEYIELNQKLHSELATPSMPRFVVPKPNATGDSIEAYTMLVTVVLTGWLKYFSKVE